ncbi:hypothetical protein LCGC14_0375490 [marine sediment metagenome]|uniref:Uncharacterized protein n=1 Tax=marine sediment metagenome TaxID=412755 RepID=A0A0F9TM43_9ZZZZ
MAALFKRAYRLTIDNLLIEKLDLDFKITRSLKREPNTAEINVKNLSPDSRQAVEEKKIAAVTFEAGYERSPGTPEQEGFAETSLIFAGDLRTAHTTREEADLITHVKSGDGEKRHRQARTSKSYAPGTSIKKAIEDLVTAMGLGLGNLKALGKVEFPFAGAVFPNGTVVSGNVAAELDGLLRSAGLEYSIQNGAVQIVTRRRALSGEAIVLSPTTGLIDTPSVSSDGIARARTLMIADLFPGRTVRFETNRVTGFFRVNKAEYTGDTASIDWFVDIECEPLVSAA